MKRSNIALLVLTILTVACQPQVDRFTVNGQISQADGKMLYLDHLALDKIEVIDSVKLDADGQFSFNPAAPMDCFDFYRLRLDGKVINLCIDSTETVTVTAKEPIMQTIYTVEGSENCSKLKELVMRQMDFKQDLRNLGINFTGNDIKKLEGQISEMVDVFKSELLTDFIMPGPGTPYAYYALFMSLNGQMVFNPQTDRQDAKCYAAVATQMDIKYPDALRTTHLHNVALKGMSKTSPSKNNSVSDEIIQKFESLIVETGLIEIELPDCDGKIRRLSDEKGKVVLLDFTAYKTNYSPNYNMLLRNLYNKYADQGFTIYQVSVDSDESYWHNAVRNLPWVCVYDEESVNSSYLRSYNVQQIPTVFLIDRNGSITDRPDNTSELDSKIAELLK